MLSILERHFGRARKLGEILRDISSLSNEQLTKTFEIENKEKEGKLLGEILLREGSIEEKDLHKALSIQKNREQ